MRRRRTPIRLGFGLVRSGPLPGAELPISLSLSLPVYHYQLKIHFSSRVDRSEMEPSLTVSLFGTEGEAENLELKL